MIYESEVEITMTLKTLLHSLHKVAGRDTSCAQSIRGGTQISLMGEGGNFKAVARLRRSILDAARQHFGGEDSITYRGLWSIRMQKGGYHVAHNHPEGWISGVCYVDVPDETSATLELDGRRHVRPHPGKVVFFPSFLMHRTTEYRGTEPRLTVAFDLEREQ